MDVRPPAKKLFLTTVIMGFAAAWAIDCGPAPPEGSTRLRRAPNSWGKSVGHSSGWIMPGNPQRGVFTGHVELANLEPNHAYVLSINGKPPDASNQLLPSRSGGEGYVDFNRLSTDPQGNAKVDFSVDLPAGSYEVKFFVKDPTDWKVVLYNDLLRFTVQ